MTTNFRHRRRRKIAALLLTTLLVTMTGGVSLAMGSGSIAGIVFDDSAADGLNDGVAGDSGNPGIGSATVHLFHDDGAVIGSPDALDTAAVGSPFTANPAGLFIVTNLADGDYWVAVDSLSLHTSAWPDQTWGPPNSLTNTGTSLATGFAYSGRSIDRSDTLAITGSLSDAEHVAGVTVSGGGAVTGLEFGFSHNVVTNNAGGDGTDHVVLDSARSVQGSLRQFLDNANLLAGSNEMRFVPVTTANGASAAAGWHRIVVSTPLPTISDAATTVDGTVISFADGATIVDPNPGGIGQAAITPGFTVGVDGLALPLVAKPDLELVGASGTNNAFLVTGADAVIRNVSLRGFDVAAIELSAADRAFISQSVIGVSPVGLIDPGVGSRNAMGIQVTGGDDGLIDSNLIAFNGSVGINFPIAHDDWTISGNEIVSNGVELTWADEIRLVGGTGTLISGNYIHDGNQIGIEIRVDVRSLTVINNTVDGNGAGGNEVAGIREINRGAWPHTIEANIVTNNVGPGVLISRDNVANPAPSLATLTRNSFGGNGRMAIDITLDAADRVWGDGPNPLVTACGTASGANEEINRPQITSVTTASSWTRFIGTGCASAAIEFFTATPDADLSDTFGVFDYGEPISYLGSTAITAAGTFDVFLPAATAVGTPITATVTDAAGNTSEQASNQFVASANIPIIIRLGVDPLTAEAGVAYVDPGATASDVEDGDLTTSIVTFDPVDPFMLGNYLVTYDVTDSDGFPADQITRSVVVVDTNSPVLTLLGANPVSVEAGTAFIDPGATAIDSFEGDLTGSIVISGSVDVNTIGSYPLTYSVSDGSGNGSLVIRTVTVVDTGSPVLALLGVSPMVVPQLSTFNDPGATAVDAFEGDISSSIMVGGSVDTLTRGTYFLSYDVSDSSGNAAPTINREVLVADANPPVITMLGSDPLTIEAGAGYTDAGALAFDAEDGELTSAIVIANPVNQLVPATYMVTYDVADLSGNAASATRSVTVEDTTPPTITLIGANPYVVTIGGVFVEPGATASDSVDGDLTALIQTVGTVDTNAIDTYTVAYSVSDSSGNIDQLERTVYVVLNQPPTARNDVYSVEQGGTLVVTAPGVLANDTDPDGDTGTPSPGLTAELVGGARHGTTQVFPVGSFTYVHDGETTETDTFTYRVFDVDGGVDTATVTVTIVAINHAPEASADFVSLDEDEVATFDLLANDSDPDGDVIVATTVGFDANVGLSLNGATVTITPMANWSGVIVVPYRISDGELSASAQLTVAVRAINDAPIARDDHAEVSMGGSVEIPVMDNDSDIEDRVVGLVSVNAPQSGSVETTPDGVVYEPDDLFVGTDSFDYTISDTGGSTATGRVTVVVSAVVLPEGAIAAWATDTIPSSETLDGTRRASEIGLFGAAVMVPLVLLADAIFQHLEAFRIPLALLGITALWVIGFARTPGKSGNGRRYAVVLLDRESSLVVRSAPSADAEEIHSFSSAVRQIDSNGRVRRLAHGRWIQVETPNGDGWVDADHLTEDAAKSTFESDMADGRILDALRSRLARGRLPRRWRRLAIDMNALIRNTGSPTIDEGQRKHLLAALSDDRSTILLDRTAAPTSLRPNRLRNFHWVTVAPVSGPAWQVLFEYHRGRPRVAGVRLESVAVST